LLKKSFVLTAAELFADLILFVALNKNVGFNLGFLQVVLVSSHWRPSWPKDGAEPICSNLHAVR